MNLDPSSCYCLRMRKAALAAAQFYNRILAPSGVTARQYFLLLQVGRLDCCNVRQLAEAAGLDRSTLSRSLKPLFEQGLLLDAKQPQAKSSRLRLTEQGQAVLVQAGSLWEQAQLMLERQAGAEGIAAFEQVFSILDTL